MPPIWPSRLRGRRPRRSRVGRVGMSAANVGYSWGNARIAGNGSMNEITAIEPFGFTNSNTTRLDGVISGGQIGYNYQFSSTLCWDLRPRLRRTRSRSPARIIERRIIDRAGCLGSNTPRPNISGLGRYRQGSLGRPRTCIEDNRRQCSDGASVLARFGKQAPSKRNRVPNFVMPTLACCCASTAAEFDSHAFQAATPFLS